MNIPRRKQELCRGCVLGLTVFPLQTVHQENFCQKLDNQAHGTYGETESYGKYVCDVPRTRIVKIKVHTGRGMHSRRLYGILHGQHLEAGYSISLDIPSFRESAALGLDFMSVYPKQKAGVVNSRIGSKVAALSICAS